MILPDTDLEKALDLRRVYGGDKGLSDLLKVSKPVVCAALAKNELDEQTIRRLTYKVRRHWQTWMKR